MVRLVEGGEGTEAKTQSGERWRWETEKRRLISIAPQICNAKGKKIRFFIGKLFDAIDEEDREEHKNFTWWKITKQTWEWVTAEKFSKQVERIAELKPETRAECVKGIGEAGSEGMVVAGAGAALRSGVIFQSSMAVFVVNDSLFD